ncbi:MAG: M48 family metalloprotease [Microcoleus vaginatus WJT46-NPBG5]|jgi:predicted Zn-dependent protease|nr:M48 family metalloprotease [Microcoleus vaginatus WJT46-NPBG5]
MFNPLSLISRSPHRRWFYALLSVVVAMSVTVGSSYPSQAISIGDIFRGGIQVIQGIQISNMSDEKEVEFGKQINNQLRREVKISRNAELNKYIDQIGQRLAAQSDRPNIPYTFQVVTDDNINAFATVGGFVYINTGLIKAADNESQLASVIGHEIGHISGKHVLKGIRKASIEQGLASAAGMDRNTAVRLGVQVALRLPRSRNYEYEADKTGLMALKGAGYAQSGMIGFFEKLLGKGRSAPTFLSSHPATEDRIAAIKQSLDPAQASVGDGQDSAAYKAKTQQLLK